jgi:hypothetical protein
LDLQVWLNESESALRSSINCWLPTQLSEKDRGELLDHFVVDLLSALDEALIGLQSSIQEEDIGDHLVKDHEAASVYGAITTLAEAGNLDAQSDENETLDADPEPDNNAGVDAAAVNLLDRLLYWGVLPRYA